MAASLAFKLAANAHKTEFDRYVGEAKKNDIAVAHKQRYRELMRLSKSHEKAGLNNGRGQPIEHSAIKGAIDEALSVAADPKADAQR